MRFRRAVSSASMPATNCLTTTGVSTPRSILFVDASDGYSARRGATSTARRPPVARTWTSRPSARLQDLDPGTPVHCAVPAGRSISVAAAKAVSVSFLTQSSIELLVEYRQIDYLPAPGIRSTCPSLLRQIDSADVDLEAILSEDDFDAIWERVAQLDLPDLDRLPRAPTEA